MRRVVGNNGVCKKMVVGTLLSKILVMLICGRMIIRPYENRNNDLSI